MNEKDFKNQFFGDFTPDQRDIDLHERLKKYYLDTPDSMNNYDALRYLKEFKQWSLDHGYTQEEVNRAKMNFNHS